MPKYIVMIETYATAWVSVVASADADREEIMLKALADTGKHPTLCMGCIGGGGTPWEELELCDNWKPFKNHKGQWEIERVS